MMCLLLYRLHNITPTEPSNGVKAQGIFDTVVEASGCASAAYAAKLQCLRGFDFAICS